MILGVVPPNPRLRRVSSRQNSLVKELRALFRQPDAGADSVCAIESVRVVEEALRSGVRFRAAFFAESAQRRANEMVGRFPREVELLLLPDEVFESAVATESPQGVAALVELPEHSLEEALAARQPLLVATAGLQDPGNLGTILRSLEAFGGTALLHGEGSVSFRNAKAVRASAGSVFRVAVVSARLGDAIATLRKRGITAIGTSSHEGRAAANMDLTRPVALFIGNEGAGLPDELHEQMDEFVTIPQAKPVESLNAGVATSILLYEAARQRERKPTTESQRHRGR